MATPSSVRGANSWRVAILTLRVLLTVIGAVALAWSAGYCAYALSIPRVPDNGTSRTDAIVVPTGGAGRLEEGMALLSAGLARSLFITGVPAGLEVSDLFDRYAGQSDVGELIDCCVELGHGAEDTTGNATETAAWMAENGYSSLRLVTASYHMTRSMTEFHLAMPGATLVANPIFSRHVKVDDWWRYKGTAGLIASEYAKYLATLLRAATSGGRTPSTRS